MLHSPYIELMIRSNCPMIPAGCVFLTLIILFADGTLFSFPGMYTRNGLRVVTMNFALKT
uniref:Uncharacterized protein n=1 Tax=Arundo donax TaxID=35708 RepID=A0A0A9FEU8_ARUDO